MNLEKKKFSIELFVNDALCNSSFIEKKHSGASADFFTLSHHCTTLGAIFSTTTRILCSGDVVYYKGSKFQSGRARIQDS